MATYCNGEVSQVAVTRTGLRVRLPGGRERHVSFFDVIDARTPESAICIHTPAGRFTFTGQTGQLLSDVRRAFFEFYVDLRIGDLLYTGARDGDVCAICLTAEREGGDDWVQFKCCRNLVHLQCMKTILKRRLPCPFCRSTVCKFCNGGGCDAAYSWASG